MKRTVEPVQHAGDTIMQQANEAGASMAEYAFILSLVALVALVTLGSIGPKVAAYYASFTSGSP